MKRFLTLICLGALVCGSASSQLLWKVSGPYGPSYIFGTYHLAPSSFANEVKGLNEALASVDMVVGELRADEMLSPATDKSIANAMVAPSDSTLDKIVSAEEYQLIAATLNHYFNGLVSIDNLKGFKPACITTQLELMEAVTHFPNYNPKETIDISLQQRGAALGKETAGLEGVNEQLEILLGQSIAAQAHDLIGVCRNEKQFADYNNKIVAAYLAQDLTRLDELISDNTLGFDADSKERLIYSRNRRWAKALQPMMRDGHTVLVVVGAGHLMGEQGLLELLKNDGYTVVPVSL